MPSLLEILTVGEKQRKREHPDRQKLVLANRGRAVKISLVCKVLEQKSHPFFTSRLFYVRNYTAVHKNRIYICIYLLITGAPLYIVSMWHAKNMSGQQISPVTNFPPACLSTPASPTNRYTRTRSHGTFYAQCPPKHYPPMLIIEDIWHGPMFIMPRQHAL
jgi:hypothetical protein